LTIAFQGDQIIGNVKSVNAESLNVEYHQERQKITTNVEYCRILIEFVKSPANGAGAWYKLLTNGNLLNYEKKNSNNLVVHWHS
jgi:hypothetical protein